jgi:hypothetical protein
VRMEGGGVQWAPGIHHVHQAPPAVCVTSRGAATLPGILPESGTASGPETQPVCIRSCLVFGAGRSR